MTKERTVLLRTTGFSVESGEAAVGARPATVASDEEERFRTVGRAIAMREWERCKWVRAAATW